MIKTEVPQRDYQIDPLYRTLLQLVDVDGTHINSAVYIHHGHLDSLIGRLMQMCDLIGDVEQRKALKDTIKDIARKWLNEEFANSGADGLGFPLDRVVPLIVPTHTHLATKE